MISLSDDFKIFLHTNNIIIYGLRQHYVVCETFYFAIQDSEGLCQPIHNDTTQNIESQYFTKIVCPSSHNLY